MEVRNADVVPQCPICGFTMKWWFAKWKCFNCGQWNGCCGDATGDPGGLWSEPCEREQPSKLASNPSSESGSDSKSESTDRHDS